jgi:DNA-binding GntR family transcriptional regulator
MRHNSTPETIKRKTLHLELVKRRQLLIIGGELSPCAKVPDKMLCTRFSVSRTPSGRR